MISGKFSKVAVAGVIALATVFSATACSSDPKPEEMIQPIPAPSFVDLAAYKGETIPVVVGGTVVLNVANGTQGDWTGKSKDDKVAVFIEGIFTDNVVATPGINAVSEGKTSISLTNKNTDETKTLKVEVTKAE